MIEIDKKKTIRQFEWMTGPMPFKSELVIDQSTNASDPDKAKSEKPVLKPRMSRKALLAALMIFTYHQEPQFQRFYEMLGLFIEVDGLMSSWRRTYTRDASSFNQIYADFLSTHRRTCCTGSTTDWSQVRLWWHRWYRLSHQNTIVSIGCLREVTDRAIRFSRKSEFKLCSVVNVRLPVGECGALLMTNQRLSTEGTDFSSFLFLGRNIEFSSI